MSVTTGASRDGARICMPTWRQFSRKVFECGVYEAQDVLAGAANVDLVALQATSSFRTRERWLNRVLYRDPSHSFVDANPGLVPVHLEQDYDLFLAFCNGFEDLLYVNAVRNWKERSRVSACWIDEIWAAGLSKYRHWLPLLQRFDHLFVSHSAAASVLTTALHRPVHWLPPAVDAVRFSPYPDPPPLAVDVYSVGRRPEGVHRVLRRLGTERQLHYVFDTFKASLADVYDPAQHRELFANLAKRSRYFLVAPPKFDAPGETAGEAEIGFRFYEGAAAGAVLLGQRSQNPAFESLFGWTDAVIDVLPDGSDLEATMAALDADPARVDAIRRRNAAQALLRHDWVYRWHELLDRVGIGIGTGMREREAHLQELARMASGSDLVVPPEPRHVTMSATTRASVAEPPAPLVSIVVNNYNYSTFLRQAIDSALAQTYPHVEVIVVDDGSTDESQEIIESSRRAGTAIFKANGGQASCLNAGFAVSRGDLVLFLDSDDYYQPDAVQAVVDQAGANIALVQFRLWLINRDGRIDGTYPSRAESLESGDVTPTLLRNGSFGGTVTTGNAFARAALLSVMPIPEAPFRIAADGFLIRAVPFHGDVAVIDRPLACYRQHGANQSGIVTGDAVDPQQLRTKLSWAHNEIQTVRDMAAKFGLTVAADVEYRSVRNLMVYRMASLRLDPRRHPIPSDRRWALGWRGAWSCLSGGCGPTPHFGMALWFLTLGVAPAGVCEPVVNFVLHRSGLSGVRALKRLKQRFRSPGEPRAEAAVGGRWV